MFVGEPSQSESAQNGKRQSEPEGRGGKLDGSVDDVGLVYGCQRVQFASIINRNLLV